MVHICHLEQWIYSLK